MSTCNELKRINPGLPRDPFFSALFCGLEQFFRWDEIFWKDKFFFNIVQRDKKSRSACVNSYKINSLLLEKTWETAKINSRDMTCILGKKKLVKNLKFPLFFPFFLLFVNLKKKLKLHRFLRTLINSGYKKYWKMKKKMIYSFHFFFFVDGSINFENFFSCVCVIIIPTFQ